MERHQQRIVAIDYGTKRIGLAESDPLQRFAQPVGTFQRMELLRILEKKTAESAVERIVVGYPLNNDGSHNVMTAMVDRFIATLAARFPSIPVERIDEHRSSREAMQILKASGVKKKERNRKGRLDRAAACVILQNYLETRNR